MVLIYCTKLLRSDMFDNKEFLSGQLHFLFRVTLFVCFESDISLKYFASQSQIRRPSAFKNSSIIPANAADSPRVSLNPLSPPTLNMERKSLIS